MILFALFLTGLTLSIGAIVYLLIVLEARELGGPPRARNILPPNDFRECARESDSSLILP